MILEQFFKTTYLKKTCKHIFILLFKKNLEKQGRKIITNSPMCGFFFFFFLTWAHSICDLSTEAKRFGNLFRLNPGKASLLDILSPERCLFRGFPARKLTCHLTTWHRGTTASTGGLLSR